MIDRTEIRKILEQLPDVARTKDHDVFAVIHEERRGLRHRRAKSTQPKLETDLHWRDLQQLIGALTAPLTLDEQVPEGMDYLCSTVHDCVRSGDFPDILYSLVRLYRKASAMQPHLDHLTRTHPDATVR